MKLAIMQPYLFAYIGYFQLIHSVDKFVIYDDVNFIKQGWINRNRILLNDKDSFLTLQLFGVSSFKLINQIEVGNNQKVLLKKIEHAYKEAPYFKEVFPLLETILLNQEKKLDKFVEYSLCLINKYLNISTEIIISSALVKKNELKNQEKVIHICELLNAKTYINAIGGKELYQKDKFLGKGIDLVFIKTKEITYKQFNNKFVPNLSIVDIMMFNSKEEIQNMLKEYELI